MAVTAITWVPEGIAYASNYCIDYSARSSGFVNRTRYNKIVEFNELGFFIIVHEASFSSTQIKKLKNSSKEESSCLIEHVLDFSEKHFGEYPERVNFVLKGFLLKLKVFLNESEVLKHIDGVIMVGGYDAYKNQLIAYIQQESNQGASSDIWKIKTLNGNQVSPQVEIFTRYNYGRITVGEEFLTGISDVEKLQEPVSPSLEEVENDCVRRVRSSIDKQYRDDGGGSILSGIVIKKRIKNNVNANRDF